MKQTTKDELFRVIVYGLAGIGVAQIVHPHPLHDFLSTILSVTNFVVFALFFGIYSARNR